MNINRFKIIKLSFVLTLLMMFTSGQAVAGKLTIVNGDQNNGAVFTFSPQAGQYHCFYNLEHFLGSKHSVGPGGSFSFHVNRTCSGGSAQFSIYTEDQKRIKFEMHGDDEFLYKETTAADGGYACESKNCFTRNAMDGSSSFTTNVVAKKASEDLATGKDAKADWILICNKACNKTISVTITKGTSEETVTSQESTKSIADSLTASLELPYGASLEGTHSEESSKTMGEEFSHAVTYEQSIENTETVEYSAEDFNNYGIESIWQWVARVPMNSHKMSIVKTKKYTCTSDGKKPTYLPGSPEDVGSCNTEVEKELSAKEKVELALLELQLAEAKAKAQGQPQAQAAAPQTTQSPFINATPANSPVSISVPRNWKSVKQASNSFDLVFTDPQEEASVLFEFMNISSVAQEVKAAEVELIKWIGALESNGKSGNTSISGMPAEYAEYIATPGGVKYEVGVVIFQASPSRAVFMTTIVNSDKSQQYAKTIEKILLALKPR